MLYPGLPPQTLTPARIKQDLDEANRRMSSFAFTLPGGERNFALGTIPDETTLEFSDKEQDTMLVKNGIQLGTGPSIPKDDVYGGNNEVTLDGFQGDKAGAPRTLDGNHKFEIETYGSMKVFLPYTPAQALETHTKGRQITVYPKRGKNRGK